MQVHVLCILVVVLDNQMVKLMKCIAVYPVFIEIAQMRIIYIAIPARPVPLLHSLF